MSSEKDYINVTVAIIKEGNKFLIAKRNKNQIFKGWAEKWEFPGGKIEPNEKIEDCLRREISEELGLKIKIEESYLVYEHDYNRTDGKKYRFFSFWCKILEGKPFLTVHDEVTWVKLEELPGFDFVKADEKLVNKLLIEKA